MCVLRRPEKRKGKYTVWFLVEIYLPNINLVDLLSRTSAYNPNC